MNNILYIVIPCYKEETVLPETAKRLDEKMSLLIEDKKISKKSRVVFVNDGSNDKTWEIISSLKAQNKFFGGINLSKNCGHQNALLAGLGVAVNYADMIISMDADLQDDINAIDSMIAEYNNGFDIVYGVRSNRKSDTFFKRFSAKCFYKFMKCLGAEIIDNHADFRLMSSRAVKSLLEFDEVNIFLRGIVPLLGYNYTTVEYERKKRFAGESKYSLKKMIMFAFDGITSFSVKPIRMVTLIGAVICVFSVAALIWSVISKIVGSAVRGWSSLMISIWFVGGVQILCLGIIGEYVGKIYSETKHRPKYIITDIEIEN